MLQITLPPLCIHKAKNLAYVRGPSPERKIFYLGKKTDPDTATRYRRFCAAFITEGGWPSGFFNSTPERGPSVRDLTASYRREVDVLNMPKDTYAEGVAALLDDICGDMPIAGFTGRDMQRLVFLVAKAGTHRRSSVNRYLSAAKRIFRHGVMVGIVTPEVHAQICAVEGLRRGQVEELPEPVKRMPVSFEVVKATCKHLPETLRAVIMLLWHTGARPSEILTLRPCDIVREGDVWHAALKDHKTASRGRDRTIYFGPQCQEILRPFLLRGDAEFLFSPKDAMRQRWSKCKGHRRPGQPGRTPKTDRLITDCYDGHALRRAVERVCEDHDIERWTPYQLRHAFATRARAALGIEAAQIALGHADAGITLTYAQADSEKARAVAAALG